MGNPVNNAVSLSMQQFAPFLGVAQGAMDGIFGLLGRIGAKKRERRALKQNMKLMDYQYSKNLEMWEKQNEYNSPANQRRLLEEAGLNPNLIYGHGTQASRAATAPQYEAPEFKPEERRPIRMPDMLGMYQSIQAGQADLAYKKAITRNINQDVKDKKSNEKMRKLDYAMKLFGFDEDKIWSGQEREHKFKILQETLKSKEAQNALNELLDKPTAIAPQGIRYEIQSKRASGGRIADMFKEARAKMEKGSLIYNLSFMLEAVLETIQGK